MQCWFCDNTGDCTHCEGEGVYDCEACGTCNVECPVCKGTGKCLQCQPPEVKE